MNVPRGEQRDISHVHEFGTTDWHHLCLELCARQEQWGVRTHISPPALHMYDEKTLEAHARGRPPPRARITCGPRRWLQNLTMEDWRSARGVH